MTLIRAASCSWDVCVKARQGSSVWVVKWRRWRTTQETGSSEKQALPSVATAPCICSLGTNRVPRSNFPDSALQFFSPSTPELLTKRQESSQSVESWCTRWGVYRWLSLKPAPFMKSPHPPPSFQERSGLYVCICLPLLLGPQMFQMWCWLVRNRGKG